MRTEIDFSYYPYKDVNLLRWITRIEKEIDEYVETNGSFSFNLVDKFYDILYELMTNPRGELMGELDRVLSDKLKRPAVLDDVLLLCKYLKAKMQQKKEEYTKLKPKYLYGSNS